MLTREQILGRRPERLVVDVPEWGDQVLIQAMTVAAAHAVEPGQGAMIGFVIASVITDDGKPMFSPEDRDSLSQLPFSGIKRLTDAIVAFNKLSADAVEDVAKNLEPGPNGASSSA